MTHEEAAVLLHALADGELDAGHAREVEAHAATCRRCRALLRDYREMHQALAAPTVGYRAPASLRARIEQALPDAIEQAPSAPKVVSIRTSRRSLLQGFAMGSVMSAALAASLVLFVTHRDENELVLGDVVSAHLRSLQSDRLIDVQSTSEHTVKPWFNGKLDLAPPVVDLTADGFPLIGGRLDYVEGRPVAAIVYKRRAHVINLFVAASDALPTGAPNGTFEKVQGFNVWRWSHADLNYWAVSDVELADLQEFAARLEAGIKSGS